MDERALIGAAQKGDVQAFNQLIREYQGLAYNVSYRILGDSEEAADACQEAFLSAFKNIRQFRGGSFKAWIMRIVTNACYDQLRHKKRRPSESLDDLLEDPDHSNLVADPAPEPETQALRHELEKTIMDGIQTLPDEQRLTLVLADVQGFSYGEVAEITRTSLGTVKSRLSRGRASLRDYLVARRELLPAQYRPKDKEGLP
jgi:RNA polymerase sigma-70 factor (ECF subfamily)